jgi:hypothetical protein
LRLECPAFLSFLESEGRIVVFFSAVTVAVLDLFVPVKAQGPSASEERV